MNSSTSFLDVLSNAFAAVFMLLIAVAVNMGNGKQAKASANTASGSKVGDVPVTTLDLYPVPKDDLPDSMRISVTVELMGNNAAQTRLSAKTTNGEVQIVARKGTGVLKNRWWFFQDGPTEGAWRIEIPGTPLPDSVCVNVFKGLQHACMKKIAVRGVSPFTVATIAQVNNIYIEPNILIGGYETCY
jgi:hypothetical protein